MIPKDCKRLAEVDFPIATVSRHAAREKSIRHGHPSTLHLWWARRPLASSRAVLLALLLPDPCDKLCPSDFKSQARAALYPLPGVGNIGSDDMALRQALLKFTGDFAAWELSSDKNYLQAARTLVHAAQPEETPLVVDPFAGGGAIPLEALRLDCDAFASDLNPVACLILRVMLEEIPRQGPELAQELLRVGVEIRSAAQEGLARFYPPDQDGGRPIAYLWARTVKCESPDQNCGAEIPLMRSFWLSKKADRKRALRPKVIRRRGQAPHVELEIFAPHGDDEVHAGTVSRARATCLCCGKPLLPERVRAQLQMQQGGADVVFDAEGNRIGGALLLAVVTLKEDESGRHYRSPSKEDYLAVWRARKALDAASRTSFSSGLSAVPDEPTPAGGGSGAGRAFSLQNYGMMVFRNMFTARQNIALLTFARELSKLNPNNRAISLAFGKLVDLSNAICPWEPNAECPRNVLSLGRIKTSWDFAEGVPTSESSGSFIVCVENLANGVISTRGVEKGATTQLAAAQDSPLPTQSCNVWFTDPPYYDAIPYADLSDMFFVWYKRALPNDPLLKDPFDVSNPLTPKALEAVQDDARSVNGGVKDKRFFEQTMAQAFTEGRRVLREDGIGSVVFAHKTTEGWEALLTGIIRGGWVITGSWPLATEQAYRLRARDSAALATSVHLVCRPRSEDASVGDWTDVLNGNTSDKTEGLLQRVPAWMERLQSEGVRGADLVFACIGPALEIYSRYSKVVDAEDREIPLGGNPEASEPYKRGYLAYVWEVVGRAALEQVLGTAEARARNGAAGALEEDARLTALFLWTLQSTNAGEDARPAQAAPEAEAEDDSEDEEVERPRKKKGFPLIFDVVRRFAQPLGIHLQDWEGRIIETEKGIVTLLPVAERAKQLFGEEGADAVAAELEEDPGRAMQLGLGLFPEERSAAPDIRIGKRRKSSAGEVSDETLRAHRGATTLDRVHAALLLQKGGRTNALRALLQAEQERGPDFLRLANALSALYPRDSEEKRLLDAMLQTMPR